MPFRNMKLVFVLIVLVALSGCQKPEKQTIEQNKTVGKEVTAVSQKDTVNENEEDIYIPGDAKEYLKKEELNSPELLINDELEPIYDKYKNTLDDKLLKGYNLSIY